MSPDEKRKLIAKLNFIKAIKETSENDTDLLDFKKEWILSERMKKVWKGIFSEFNLDILDEFK